MSENLEKNVILKDLTGAELYPKTRANILEIRNLDYNSDHDYGTYTLAQIVPWINSGDMLVSTGTLPAKLTSYYANYANNLHIKYYSYNAANVSEYGCSYILGSDYQGTPGLAIDNSGDGFGNYYGAITSFNYSEAPANLTILTIPKYTYSTYLAADKFLPVSCVSWRAFDAKLATIKTIKLPDTINTINQHAFANNANLSTIFIPNSVTNIGSSAFNNCNNLTIFTEFAEKPNGWDNNWNPNSRPVIWSSKLVDPMEYLYISAPQTNTQINTEGVVLMQYDNNQQ